MSYLPYLIPKQSKESLIVKTNLTLAAVLLTTAISSQANAAETEYENGDLLNISAEARIDFQQDWNDDGHTVKSNSGFTPKYLNFRIDGSIVPDLTYSWRQRIYKPGIDNLFDATDWIYLQYRLKGWSFSAGKEVVKIGGFEYDRAPIDIYSGSVFWNNINCYELGVSVGYNVTANDMLSIQAVQSPFYTKENKTMYGYNLMWTGQHGCFSALYSANLFEYLPGKFINYLALGNRFDFGPVRLELDLMNRAASGQTFLFKDCSIMADLAYTPAPRWRVHGKFTYDVNKSGTTKDFTVANGTELKMAGAGVEFFPLLKKRTSLRLHGNFYYSWGHNANSADVMQHNTCLLDFGITWDMNIFSLNRKH